MILEEFDILDANDMLLLRKRVQIPHADQVIDAIASLLKLLQVSTLLVVVL